MACHCRWAGHGVRGSLVRSGCFLGRAGLVFFMDCESGSGAFLDAQDVSVGFGGAALRWCGSGLYREVRDGLAWVV